MGRDLPDADGPGVVALNGYSKVASPNLPFGLYKSLPVELMLSK
jgi:hypothetical protein